ncbi:hypothetical protein ACH5RR_024285 [Cinchona calisaya]|uniref:Uncharacterized protein n=1 Tax=Cinchona calisaya TaxID=153742 RepID=A0ABD2YXC2_9GENT
MLRLVHLYLEVLTCPQQKPLLVLLVPHCLQLFIWSSQMEKIWLRFFTLRLLGVRNNYILANNSQKVNGKLGPHLLREPPKINMPPPEAVTSEDEEGSCGSLPAIKIYDDEINIRFLVCGEARSLDATLLGSLVDGLNALLNIEMRGSKLHNWVSALPPPLQAGAFSCGVVIMRCDISTSSVRVTFHF